MQTRQTRRGPKPKPGTRDNLIQAGLELIHTEGYSASGIQSIVARADVPKGSFYTYFASKEAFGTEVLTAYSDRGLAKLRSFLCNTNLTPLERLEAYFDDRIAAFRTSNFVRGCLLGNFSAEAADHSTTIRKQVAEHFKSWSAAFEQCLLEGQKMREISTEFSATSLANFLFNSWEGALLRMRAEKSDAALVEFKKIALGSLVRRTPR
ncbi:MULTISPECIES: TetR family transcriptional regulator C-terminal domain-containing protein [unclassified Bradyrhizobium]|uniref:TetR family transcriptional regulator C-terminal domain-containing protein n=1 Tax=unclassified Bradyrhizobium TaxID=2631580 RepID=UPI0028E4AFD0|nr:MULTISPECIES: TetR family transcriptional regulator C-terminal domain-containing protein [unclassified Bradyrhizobium]